MLRYAPKFIATFILLAQLSSFVPSALANQEGTRTCVVTAYYSPKPGQKAYVTGSEYSDKILNGQGTHAADGTPVYLGMAAAPGNFAFGTLIEIPGFAMLKVHDRGGAIVEGGNYFRLDVWTGEGDKGMAQALNFGRRTFECNVHPPGTDKAVYVDLSNIPDSLPENKLAQLKTKSTSSKPSLSNQESSAQSISFDYQSLQASLADLGYYQKQVNGIYDEATREAVIDFQMDHLIVSSDTSFGAGFFGPKTQLALQQVLEHKEVPTPQNTSEKEFIAESLENQYLLEQQRLKENISRLVPGLTQGDEGEAVRWLQQVLWEVGYYRDILTGVYDQATTEAVFIFQKDWAIVSSQSDLGAGIFGPKTLTKLKEVLNKRIDYLPEYPQEVKTIFPTKNSFPLLENLHLPTAEEALAQGLNFEFFSTSSAPNDSIQVTPNQNGVNQQDFLTAELDLNDQGEQVELLQQHLIKQGYLPEGLDTGYFGYQTQAALLDFQLDEGIISYSEQPGAGRLGPVTMQKVNENLKI